jgi:competence protein ComEA
MSEEERRTAAVATAALLIASVLRFAWESRPDPQILPPAEVPAALVEETRAALEREERAGTPLASGERLDPNADDVVELDRLPGVGPALAARIVASREAEGAFRAPTDLLRVPGIGAATLARIEPLLEFPTYSGTSLPTSPRASPSTTPRPAPTTPRPAPGAPPTPSPPLIDPNRATATELEALPGIGPALAERIVHHRTTRGPFSRVDDLADVRGIGQATLEVLRPLVRVGR